MSVAKGKDKNKTSYIRKRTKSREYAIQMMYSSEVSEIGADETISNFWLSFPDEEASIREFAEILFRNSFERKEQDDEVIKEFISQNWSFERINLVEKSLLRLAVNELFFGDTPVYAIMDDYVTLAKCFSDNKSASFVNGILDNIRTKFAIERENDEREQSDKH